MKSEPDFARQLIDFLESKALLIITISLVAILFATLLPFDFSIPYNFSLEYIYAKFFDTTYIFDLIVNVILFIPFGLGITAWLEKRKYLKVEKLKITFLASLSLTLTVEVCQLFLVSRNPSLSDLVTNSLGGIVGTFLFFALIKYQQQLSKLLSFLIIFRDRSLQFKSLIFLWLFYFFLMSFLLISVDDRTKLSNWDTNFYLVVGNEATGNRSWSGKVNYLCISKKSFYQQQIDKILARKNSCRALENDPDLLTTYSLSNPQKYILEPKNSTFSKEEEVTTSSENSTGIIVNPKNWLKTKNPASELTQKIKNSSQFTIFTEIATANLTQEGPARIISLSKNQYWRNLTIAQWRNDLSIRMRTPLMGGNGKKPEIRINNFFTDTNFHQLAISYNGTRLKIYVDEVAKAESLYLGSEAALFWSIFSVFTEKIYLKPASNSFYIILYYGLIFIPLGFLWGAIFNFLQTRLLGFMTFLISGLIIPPLMIETIIANTSDRYWNGSYLSIGLAMIIISFLLTKLLFNKRQKEIATNNQKPTTIKTNTN